ADLITSEQAALNAAKARQGYVEATQKAAQTQADLNVANAKGVEGSDKVVAAEDAQKQAAAQVVDSQKNLADAMRAQTRQQQDSADTIAAAQQQIADAVQAQSRATTKANEAAANSTTN